MTAAIPLSRRRRVQEEPPEHYCAHCLSLCFEDDASCQRCGEVPSEEGWSQLPAPEDPWLGRILGDRYVLEAKIGHGGSGQVYRALGLNIPRVFAVKIVGTGEDSESASVSSSIHSRNIVEDSSTSVIWMEDEVEALGLLESPHAVSLQDALWVDGDLVVVMSYINGITLSQLIREEAPITARRALGIARQVANGLSEAHRLGWIHRDLKPENVMVERLPSGDDFVRVLDFGLAELQTTRARPGHFVGTPLFASPEQIRGAELDQRTDIYSLGGILFYLLTGRPPFVADELSDVLEAHLNQPVPSVAERRGAFVQEELEQLITSMLSKSPRQRPFDLHEVIDAIDKIAPARLAGQSSDSLDIGGDVRSDSDPTDVHLQETSEFDTDSFISASSDQTSGVDATGRSVSVEMEVINEMFDGTFAGGEEVFQIALEAPEIVRIGPHGIVFLKDQNGLGWISLGESSQAVHWLFDSAPTAFGLVDRTVVVGLEDGGVAVWEQGGTVDRLFEALPARAVTAAGASREIVVVTVEGAKAYLGACDGQGWWVERHLDSNGATVAVHPDSSGFALAYEDGGIELFKVSCGRRIAFESTGFAEVSEPVISLGYSFTGHIIAGATAQGDVFLLSADTGRVLHECEPRLPGLRDIEFLDDGRLLAACALDGRLLVVDLRSEFAGAPDEIDRGDYTLVPLH